MHIMTEKAIFEQYVSLSVYLFMHSFFKFLCVAGVLVTTFALSFGLWQMKTGDKKMSQKMMRLRIFGQGFTVLAVLAGVVYGTTKKVQK